MKYFLFSPCATWYGTSGVMLIFYKDKARLRKNKLLLPFLAWKWWKSQYSTDLCAQRWSWANYGTHHFFQLQNPVLSCLPNIKKLCCYFPWQVQPNWGFLWRISAVSITKRSIFMGKNSSSTVKDYICISHKMWIKIIRQSSFQNILSCECD